MIVIIFIKVLNVSNLVYLHLFYLLFIFFSFFVKGNPNTNCIFTDSTYNLIGWGSCIKANSTVCMELDLRSTEKEKRVIHFIFDDKQEEIFFYNVPEKVKVGVCFFFFLFHINYLINSLFLFFL